MSSLCFTTWVLQLVLVRYCFAAAKQGTPEQEANRYKTAGIHSYRQGRRDFDGKQLQLAKRYLAHAVSLQPTPEAYFFLGSTLGLLSRPRSAIRAYLLSISMDRSVAATHQNAANLFDEVGNHSAALVHYRQWADLDPKSALARRSLAISLLWSGAVKDGAKMCDEAVQLDPSNPAIPFDCAQMLVLLLPPDSELEKEEDVDGQSLFGDQSSLHWNERIEPLFRRSQQVAFAQWRGGPVPHSQSDSGDPHSSIVRWTPMGPTMPENCPNGANAVRDWLEGGAITEDVTPGGEVYGQRLPQTFGGPFSWAGQRYVERGVRISMLRNVLVSGNEGIITQGCKVFVPYYDVQVPWHENLPSRGLPDTPAKMISAALWLLVMFPANFFSFLVDELARLAVWLSVREQRLPLLVPADRGRLKTFMYDWFSLFGGFEVIPYDVRPHFMGAERVAEPRFLVNELHIVDWRDPPGTARRGDVFLLPPRRAIQELRKLAVRSTQAQTVITRSSSTRVLLWIQRATASTRRVANEEILMSSIRKLLDSIPGGPWTIWTFSDVAPAPTARETVQMFHEADIVVGVHGSGQANQVFCRQGTGVIDINLPEPHSQYSAHNSYALGLRYRLVMMHGVALHQAVNISVPVDDVIDALQSLLASQN